MATASELTIDTGASALQMAEAMFGNGITINSASYTGDGNASGIFSDGLATSPGVVPSDSGVILSTGKVTDFTHSSGDPNRSAGTSTNTSGPNGDADFNALSGQPTYDAAFIEAEFVPAGNTLTMQIVFSSDEYLEYVNSGFNDVVGIWVNGVPAQLTVGTGAVSIDNINTTSNANLYVDNPRDADPYNTEMDGFSVTLTLKAPVNAGVANTIKIGIADGGDSVWDSNLLIRGDSVQTALIAGDDSIELGANSSQTLDVLANDSSTSGPGLSVIAINGVPVVAGDTVVLPTGEEITLNVNGSLTIVSDGDIGVNTFGYTVTDSAGNTDAAFVTVETVPCFAAGTPIRTPRGDVPVEELRAGDLVTTRDHGAQPLRWTGARLTVAAGAHAPVVIGAGALGAHGALTVSPQHRIAVSGALAEVMFGEAEVLVAAKDLVDGSTIRRDRSGAPVIYHHLLFDAHEIVFSAGLATESFHPGAHVLAAMSPGTRGEILSLFPELAAQPRTQAAPSLRAGEALALARAMAARAAQPDSFATRAGRSPGARAKAAAPAAASSAWPP